jgi:hypothetical protein
MSARYYAMVWINHNAAEVFRINAIEESKRVVNSLTSLDARDHLRKPLRLTLLGIGTDLPR